ncbi:ferredoxin [Arcticibacter pallidicorallinus]|uniref:Ferredoxin n=1 Tax=Arcticibacter pallidicorallinus TaxID=1259464 RepID=A0A2T0U7U8_9SPHI|nr:ferredoxin [Arcticibacter pallidicorallinus]PRY53979.1 ferredoxin [Arcticibacter pallidicorallinus]
MVRITQHRIKCIGCNACVEAAAYRWRISRKDGKVTLIQGIEKKGIFSISVAVDELEDNLRAAAHCPVNCIKVELT